MGSNRAVRGRKAKVRTEILRQTEVGTFIHEANETVYLCDIPCVAEMGVGKKEVWFF